MLGPAWRRPTLTAPGRNSSPANTRWRRADGAGFPGSVLIPCRGVCAMQAQKEAIRASLRTYGHWPSSSRRPGPPNPAGRAGWRLSSPTWWTSTGASTTTSRFPHRGVLLWAARPFLNAGWRGPGGRQNNLLEKVDEASFLISLKTLVRAGAVVRWRGCRRPLNAAALPPWARLVPAGRPRHGGAAAVFMQHGAAARPGHASPRRGQVHRASGGGIAPSPRV